MFFRELHGHKMAQLCPLSIMLIWERFKSHILIKKLQFLSHLCAFPSFRKSAWRMKKNAFFLCFSANSWAKSWVCYRIIFHLELSGNSDNQWNCCLCNRSNLIGSHRPVARRLQSEQQENHVLAPPFWNRIRLFIWVRSSRILIQDWRKIMSRLSE